MALAEPGGLRLRVASALALAPLPVAAIWFGGVWLALLTGVAGAVMAWEWGRLCRGAGAERVAPGPAEIELVGIVVMAVAIAAFGAARAAVAAAILGAGLVFWTARQKSEGEPAWTALGTLWVALPCISFLWLAREQAGGRATLLWLLAVVSATDIGAYAVGRGVGGPRLAPLWSPRKTWSGFAGGVLCAALAGGATALALGVWPALPLVLVSAGLAIVAQLGDLAESVAKRRFGVKDSSGLIPGHGGLLDRLDGFLAVIPVVALMTVVGGRGVLAWQ
ncbi:MAG TPA: phosphatidate cytidylyltransferase [Stellaceae bacterium]|nr:phosphatidate cytidylyltransferase [Stellaceae bacterium]